MIQYAKINEQSSRQIVSVQGSIYKKSEGQLLGKHARGQFLSPPMHVARWAHMHRFPSVCHWTIIHISESIIAMNLKLYDSIKMHSLYKVSSNATYYIYIHSNQNKLCDPKGFAHM